MAGKKTLYIVFTAEVLPTQTGKLRDALMNAVENGFEKIYLLISSPGGNVFEGLSIGALIKSLPVEAVTHNIGQIDSVAGVIFAAGSTRYATGNSSFMFHGVHDQINGNLGENDLKERYENLKRLRESIAKDFSAYTGIDIGRINRLMIEGGTIMSAETALTESIINEIRDAGIPPGSTIISIGNM